MTDVLETAMKYRTRLKSELTKVEEFLQMAESFSREINSEDRVTFFTNGPGNTTMALKQPVVERPRSVTNGAATA
jgi:hypothetical protein